MQSGDCADTIYAVATASGRAAVAVVRVSGPAVRDLVVRLTGSLSPARVASVRRLIGPEGLIDQALVLRFEAPHSFTGEDVVEFHTHGGRAVQGALLRALAGAPGLRPASPGEFTRRALQNGKLDLTQAEAIADLVDSDTDRQRAQALAQYGGGLARVVGAWRESLIEASALIEASLDFSDEHDVGDDATPAVLGLIRSVLGAITKQLAKRGAERLRDGFTVVIAGPPNAGKSTLLNWWAGREAAIVTPVAGTTRDLIEVDLELEGLPIKLVDTAGLRSSTDVVERIGVDRARERAKTADLVLWLDPDEGPVPQQISGVPVLHVRTKSDSDPKQLVPPYEMEISALTGAGLSELKDEVARRIGGEVTQDGIVTRERHRLALHEAKDHLIRAEAGLQLNLSPELVAEDLRCALTSLDGLIGRVTPEDVLDRVFSSFCIGK